MVDSDSSFHNAETWVTYNELARDTDPSICGLMARAVVRTGGPREVFLKKEKPRPGDGIDCSRPLLDGRTEVMEGSGRREKRG